MVADIGGRSYGGGVTRSMVDARNGEETPEAQNSGDVGCLRTQSTRSAVDGHGGRVD